MAARPEAKTATITCCFIHLEFQCGCLVTATAKIMCIFHQSLHTNSTAMLLFASSAVSAGTQARPCMNPEPCAYPAQLSSTWSSWAALSQSRELDYPLALKLHPLSFPLGRGWEAALGTNTQIPHLLIKDDFSYISPGQMDDCFEKQWVTTRIFPREKINCCGTFEKLVIDRYFVITIHLFRKVDFQHFPLKW